MAFEYSRNLQDTGYVLSTTLPNGAGSSATSGIDLGADTFKTENVELEISVPALSTTINPGTSTAGVTILMESSATSTFAAVAQTLFTVNSAGNTTTTTAAVVARVRLPSNCARYVRGKVTLGTTTGDASALTFGFRALF